MSALNVLREARVILTPHWAWTQRAAARDKSGDAELYDAPRATRFCGSGAVWRAAKELGASAETMLAAMKLLLGAAGLKANGCFAVWNDHPSRTHDEIVAAFDRAIAKAGAA